MPHPVSTAGKARSPLRPGLTLTALADCELESFRSNDGEVKIAACALVIHQVEATTESQLCSGVGSVRVKWYRESPRKNRAIPE